MTQHDINDKSYITYKLDISKHSEMKNTISNKAPEGACSGDVVGGFTVTEKAFGRFNSKGGIMANKLSIIDELFTPLQRLQFLVDVFMTGECIDFDSDNGGGPYGLGLILNDINEKIRETCKNLTESLDSQEI